MIATVSCLSDIECVLGGFDLRCSEGPHMRYPLPHKGSARPHDPIWGHMFFQQGPDAFANTSAIACLTSIKIVSWLDIKRAKKTGKWVKKDENVE